MPFNDSEKYFDELYLGWLECTRLKSNRPNSGHEEEKEEEGGAAE